MAMSEAESTSGSTLGSEDSPIKATCHLTIDEDHKAEESKQHENLKDSVKIVSADIPGEAKPVDSAEATRNINLEANLLKNNPDPISSLEKITKNQLHHHRGTLLNSSSTRKRELQEDSEEELLDIQAIEEDVHKSQNISANNIRLIKGASFIDQVKTSKPESDTHSSILKVNRSPNTTPKIPGRNRKVSGIPVGIAVAWQRNSTTTSCSNTSTMSSCIAGTSPSKSKKISNPSPTPSSLLVSPGNSDKTLSSKESKFKKLNSTKKPSKIKKEKELEKTNRLIGKGAKTPKTIKTNNGSALALNLKSSLIERAEDEQSNSNEKVKSISSGSCSSSSSTPVPLMVSVGNNNNSSNNSCSSERYNGGVDGFRSLNNNNSPYRDSWPASQLLVPQDYTAAAAAYLQHQQQQLSMHQTMQLQLSHSYGYNISSCVYSGYPAESLLQYEQFLRQQQQQQQLQLERQDRQQELIATQQQNFRDRFEMAQRQFSPGNGIRTPAISNNSSPRISIPTPSPAHVGSAQQSLYSNQSYWPTDLYQHYQQLPPAAHQYQYQPQHQLIQQHMMTTTSSTATLSPRSLSSATPSPITIHDSGFQSPLNRKCITPNPISKHFPIFSSPFSPSLVPVKDVWKDDIESKITPIPLVTNKRKKSSTISSLDEIEETREEELEQCESESRRTISRCESRQLSSPSIPNYKHDFRRMESLIEKRADESLPLFCSTSSGISNDSEQEDQAVNLKIVKESSKETSKQNLVLKNIQAEDLVTCDEMEMVVPESSSTVLNLNVVKKEKKKRPEPKNNFATSDDKKEPIKKKEKKQQDKLPKKPRKEKLDSDTSNNKPKKKNAIDHQHDLISKPKRKQNVVKSSSEKTCKEDTHRNTSKNSCNVNVVKKLDKYLNANNNPVEKCRRNPNIKLNGDDSSSNRNSNVDISSSKLNLEKLKPASREESIIYSKDSERGWRMRDQNEGKDPMIQKHEAYKISSPIGATNLNTITTTTRIYCDNDIKKPSTFDNSLNSLNVSNNSYSNTSTFPTSSNLQYQHNLHPVFTCPQAPIERRLSCHTYNSQTGNSIDNSSNSNTMIFNSLPTIVISPEDNHLNLLATVAEEVGPYISTRNLSPTHQRRYDISMVSDNNNAEDCSLRRHSTESLYAAVAAAAAAEQNNNCQGFFNSVMVPLSTNEKEDNRDEDVFASDKALLLNASSESSNNAHYQLKIPHVVRRLPDVPTKKKKQLGDKTPKIKKARSDSEPNSTKPNILKRLDSKNTHSKLSNKRLINVKQFNKDSKSRVKKNSMKSSIDSQKGRIEKKKHIMTKNGSLTSGLTSKKKKCTIISKAEVSEPVSNSTSLSSSCIYDFDDKPTELEPFCTRPEKVFHRSVQQKQNVVQSDNKRGAEGAKTPSSIVPGKMNKSCDKKYSSGKIAYVTRKANNGLKTSATVKQNNKLNKAMSSNSPTALKTAKNNINNIEKIKRSSTSRISKLNTGNKSEISMDNVKKITNIMNHVNPAEMKKKNTTKKRMIQTVSAAKKSAINTPVVGKMSPEKSSTARNSFIMKKESMTLTARGFPLSSPQFFPNTPRSHNPSSLDTCSSICSSNESSSSAWVTITNPTHIVSAIKTEPEENGEEEEGEEEIIKTITTTKRKLSIKSPKLIDGHRNTTPTTEEPLKTLKRFKDTSSESLKPQRSPSPKRKYSKDSEHYIKPCLKVEPIIRSHSEDDDVQDKFLPPSSTFSAGKTVDTKSGEKIKIRKQSIDMNIFSRKAKTEAESTAECLKMEEVVWDENVVIDGVKEMIDEMRILTEIQGLFYTGKLNALQPPDVYGVTLDNERGAPPHIIFSAEEVLEKCIREAKPWKPSQLPHGLRICAYWSPQYTGLYPGKVSTDYDCVGDLVPVEFDDGDTGVIKICEIRLLAPNHPVAEYDPNPLLTLEKKHRKRRNSSANGSQGGCTGDHEEPDCGEPYCAKVAQIQEDEDDEMGEANEDDKDFNDTYRTKMKYWTWTGLGTKKPKTKKNRHKEFFHGIQRGDEIINVGDSALFISSGNDRPFIGRIERFWEKKGQKIVNVRWFYHPEEAKTKKQFVIKYPGALFESPHIDENDVQTIAKKCEVIPFEEYKQKYGTRLKLNWKSGKGGHRIDNRKTAPKHTYYVAGFYDPYTYNLRMKDLK